MLNRSMPSRRMLHAAALALGLAGVVPSTSAEWGVNLYGLSYHWERDTARANDWDNEFNPGLGLRYTFGKWLNASAFADAGAYYDSGRNTAVYGAAGLLWPLDRDGRFHLGAAATLFHSETYNGGDAFVAPIPLFAVRFERVTVNFTHFPKVSGFNSVNTTAMFLTLPIR
ncbi:MAG: hypothetical protein ACYC46_16070 [Acidobacteriaceae bacterium]